MKIRTVDVVASGVTPLIVNRFHEDAQQAATSGIRTRSETLTPEQDATLRLYQNGKGPYFPAENLRMSIIKGGDRIKIGRRAATIDIAAALYVTPLEVPIEGEWHVDSRPIVNPSTKGRILRHRPMFNEWKMPFSMEVDVDLIDLSTVRQAVDVAGNYVGIGDFRPAKKGPYGRFRIDTWQEKVVGGS